MNAIRTLILAAALAFVPAAASAQNFLINPCGGANTCFGTGDAREAYIVTDGAKRIKVTFGAAPAIEPVGTVTLGTAANPFPAIYGTSFVGAGAFGATTFTVNGVGTAGTAGITLANGTAAAAGAQQFAPALVSNFSGWKTDATAGAQAIICRQQWQSVQGTSAPTANLVIACSINGGAFSTVGTFTSGGDFISRDLLPTRNIETTLGYIYSRTYLYVGAQGIGQRLESTGSGNLRVGNSNGSNTYDITLAEWGTTLSAEAVSVADTAVLQGPASGVGTLTISLGTDNNVGVFALTGTGAPVELHDPGTFFSVTKDTASSVNVYYESGAYRIQNLLGGTRTIRAVLIGG